MTVKVISLAVAAALSLTACKTATGQKKVCDVGTVIGSGNHDSKSKAKAAAKADWKSKAWNFAPAYANWSRAENKERSCASQGKWPNRRWSCMAKADPCRKK